MGQGQVNKTEECPWGPLTMWFCPHYFPPGFVPQKVVLAHGSMRVNPWSTAQDDLTPMTVQTH